MSDKIIFVVYAIFMLVGGYFGWKKGSNVSLIAGIVSSSLMFFGIWLMTINPRGAYIFIACVTGVLSIQFLIRLIKTQSFMPSGMLFLASAVVFIVSILPLFKRV